MKLFGKTDFAVRFPSAFAGSLTVLLTFFLVAELFPEKRKTLLPAIAAFLLAVSPWHLHFSRGEFEANLALLFLVAGALAFLQAQRRRKYTLILSVVFLVLASATYHSSRVFAPLLLIALIWIYRVNLRKIKREFIAALAIGFLLSIPFIPQIISGEALIRARSEGILEEKKPITKFFSNYLANFDTTFLFFRGDQNGRHSVRKLGMLYLFELPLILFGLKTLLKEKEKKKGKETIFAWLLLAPIPASLTKINPHALRSLNILPAWQIIAAFGGLEVLDWIVFKKDRKLKSLLALGAILIIAYNIILYLHQYYVHYPRETALDWQDGLKETVEIIAFTINQYDEIFVSDQLPPVYLGFYLPVNPAYFQSLKEEEKIGKISYFKYAYEIEKKSEKKALIVAPFWQKPAEGTGYQEVKMINGDTVFNIWED